MNDKRRPQYTCLILEDDLGTADSLASLVELQGGMPTACDTVAKALELLKKQQYDVYLFDNYLPDGRGADVFLHLRNSGSSSPVIMITGVPELETAVGLMREGLFDFLTKPLDVPRVSECLQKALNYAQLGNANVECFGVVGRSAAMRHVLQAVRRAAANPKTTVLLTGETGVGKDVVARLIHQLTFQGHQTVEPIISLNCAAVPADIFESELFGAQRGAFTGAQQDRIGLGEATKNGTLFLDEIAEVPLLLQAKLLQFLETREFRRLGSVNPRKFEGRIIAATNKSIPDEVRAGKFREDLWYRLNVFSIPVPPLRERKEDIPDLAVALLKTLAKKSERNVPMFRPEDLERLKRYDFPGNVRELRNLVERSLVLTSCDAAWLHLDTTCLQPQNAALRIQPSPQCKHGLSPIEQQEYALIREALDLEGGVIRRAAVRLQMSHQALLRRLEKWPELRGH